MKTLLLSLLLFAGCSQLTHASPCCTLDTNDARQVRDSLTQVEELQRKIQQALDSLVNRIGIDSAAMASDTTAAKRESRTRMRKAADSLRGSLAAGQNLISRYQGLLGKKKYAGGDYPQLGTILVAAVLIAIAAIFVGLVVCWQWLGKALAENVREKETQVNEMYDKNLLAFLMAQRNGSSPAGTSTTLDELKAAVDAASSAETDSKDAQQILEKANADLKTAQQGSDANALATAQTAVSNAEKDAKQKKEAADQKQLDLKTKMASFGEGTGSGISASLLANLAVLFPPTIEVTTIKEDENFRPSASRLIALISGLLLIIVALSMTAFYIYYYLISGEAPELSKLSGVLIALGIGMAPYAVSKVAHAASVREKSL